MKKNVVIIAVIVIIALAGFSILTFLDFQKSSTNTDSITVAYSPFESTALFWIAEDQGFFRDNGLNITMRKYDSGAASLDGIINGEADLTVGVTEFPLVKKAFKKEKIRTIGTINKGEFTYIVARKDRGIENVSDLKGKKVGTTIGTIAEFHLGRFLNLHGMNINDITLVDVKTPEEWVNAVADGDIDAIATAQPYANSAKDRLGTNAVFWPAQSNQPLYALIICKEDWITKHPELASRFLKSLVQAEEYVNTHPAESKAIVQKRLNLSDAYMDTVWKQNQFSLSLDQSLIFAMEDEARWMIANNLTNETKIPDFRNYIYTAGLEKVKPESVNIIG
jgi:NitT/TauT family transport system substrate-binding protein